MNSVSFGTSLQNTKGFIIKGGKHIQLGEKSPLLRERGITDMWCYTKPETGDPMIYLEGEKGELIREFNLKNQLEQLRNYFINANRLRSEGVKAKRELKELKVQLEELNAKCNLDENIRLEHWGRDNVDYFVNGRQFNTFDECLTALSKEKPELAEYIAKYRMIERRIDDLYKQLRNNPYIK